MKTNMELSYYFSKGIDFRSYLTEMKETITDRNPINLTPEEMERYQATILNYHRSSRIQRNHQLSNPLIKVLETVSTPQKWLILTEFWCGDCAQSLPIIAKMVDHQSNIKLKIVYRSQFLDLMDLYLTDGKQSIPKLIVFSQEGKELFQWGPRPKEATELFQREKDAGLNKSEILEKLHLWYGKNRGKAIETEFIALLSK